MIQVEMVMVRNGCTTYRCSVSHNIEDFNVFVLRPLENYGVEQIKKSKEYNELVKFMDNSPEVGCYFNLKAGSYTLVRTTDVHESLYCRGEGDYKEVVQLCLPAIRYEYKMSDEIIVIYRYIRLL